MIFLRMFKHVLPSGRVWRITVDKTMRRFFEGLSNALGPPVREFFDLIYLDLLAPTTQQMDEWDKTFNLPDTGLVPSVQRSRLTAAWKKSCGQSPRCIQDTLQAFGFDVYVHEWWELPVVGTPVARDPNNYLGPGNDGYPLVNKVYLSGQTQITGAGEPLMQAGEPTALAGNYLGNLFELKEYPIPTDPATFPYFLYIGAATFPNTAMIPPERKSEFEDLCLKLCPTQLWLGILINTGTPSADTLVDDVGNVLVDDSGNALTTDI